MTRCVYEIPDIVCSHVWCRIGQQIQ